MALNFPNSPTLNEIISSGESSWIWDGTSWNSYSIPNWTLSGTEIYTTYNVGIGTTNPTSKLSVVGDVKVSGVVTATSFVGAGVTVTGTTFTNQLSVSGVSNLKQITETVVNNFNSTLSPSSGTLTIDTSLSTVVLGDLNASVTTWAFTNVPTTNSKATTITVIIDGDTAQTYGDACSVNGSAITGGVKWSGGSAPTATNNFDIITFTIVKDSAGTINVFGSGNTNFS